DKSIKSESDGFSEPVSVISKSDEKIPELSDEEDVLDGPMEIDSVQQKEHHIKKKKVKCAEQSRRKDSSNRPPSTKVTNKSKPRKVEQDNNSYSACNTLPDRGKKNSQGTKRVSLEETIRKIIQIEFKNLLPYM